jgi:programmed cell death 6-interacting protein
MRYVSPSPRSARMSRNVYLTGSHFSLTDQESLISSIPRLPSGPSLSSNPITRLLHTLLESLTDLSTARQRLVDQAKHLSSTDDIRSRIISEANSIQRSSGASAVQTSWFEGLFEKELAKYEGLKREMEEKGEEAERVLEELGVQNEAFVQGRRTSPTIKAREKALMDMEVAYRMYSEIVTNLQDGIKVSLLSSSFLVQWVSD